MSTVENGKISYLSRNATAMLFCEPNYEIVGSTFAHCNGTNWDRVIGTCKETDNAPPLSCDFERKRKIKCSPKKISTLTIFCLIHSRRHNLWMAARCRS